MLASPLSLTIMVLMNERLQEKPHPLIKNLGTRLIGDESDPVLRNSILQLYEGALLIEGDLTSPNEYVSRITELVVEATK